MINTLFLPELREMLAENNAQGLAEFCNALHPSRTAEFMAGLESNEVWEVFQHTDPSNQADILSYFSRPKQVELVTQHDRQEAAAIVQMLPPDERVDLFQELEDDAREELIALMPAEIRLDVLRLQQYPEDTAGSVMTTDVTKLPEHLTIGEAMNEIARQAGQRETIYYLYIVDAEDHLRGLVSARQLLVGMGKPETPISEIMQTDLVAVHVMDDQEEVANKVARMDLLAIPVVDLERRMVGIITHDDIIDVVREEATEDAHRSAAVEPLDQSYLLTSVLTLSWKRGIWLTILFFCALLTAFALKQYEQRLEKISWLMLFIPLIISSGGNSGSQSATLIITALSRGHISVGDWAKVVVRELWMGLLLGLGLALMGVAASWLLITGADWKMIMVVPVTLILVTVSGTLTGSILPLMFEKLGLDPAMMSNPFVAGIVDILGIVIYMTVAWWFVGV